jgi:anthranilate/para-aminobenzoate synthase component I
MRLKYNFPYIIEETDIVYDSIPKKEYEETEKKAKACLTAIKLAGGLE